jgi:D-serine deaminase-like pyridoxal phosphate-dependent protein
VVVLSASRTARERTGADRTRELLEAQIGRSVEELETPVATVDLDRLDGNMRRLQAYADKHGVALWPHTKTHKSAEIALRQLEVGAAGLTVAKTGEAAYLHEAGVRRLLVHYPPVGRDKWERLARLAADGLELTVALDGTEAAEGLSAALAAHGAEAELLVELDVGLHRTGQVTVDGAVGLARRLAQLPCLSVAGISGYPGHCRGDAETIRARVVEVDALMSAARDAFIDAGLPCGRVSGGSTPTRYLTDLTCVNELRAGTYVLMDRNEDEVADEEAQALLVEVTVVSNSLPGQIVIDAGSKTLTSDPHDDGNYGEIVGLPGARFRDINEEHGYIDVAEVESPPAVGDRLRVVPNHACGCVNLHDGLLGIRSGQAETVIAVGGRGLVR